MIINLGPIRSVSLPVKIWRNPMRTMQSEKAPEVIVLVQPKSADNGLKKIPNEKNVPWVTIRIRQATITMIYP